MFKALTLTSSYCRIPFSNLSSRPSQSKTLLSSWLVPFLVGSHHNLITASTLRQLYISLQKKHTIYTTQRSTPSTSLSKSAAYITSDDINPHSTAKHLSNF